MGQVELNLEWTNVTSLLDQIAGIAQVQVSSSPRLEFLISGGAK